MGAVGGALAGAGEVVVAVVVAAAVVTVAVAAAVAVAVAVAVVAVVAVAVAVGRDPARGGGAILARSVCRRCCQHAVASLRCCVAVC